MSFTNPYRMAPPESYRFICKAPTTQRFALAAICSELDIDLEYRQTKAGPVVVLETTEQVLRALERKLGVPIEVLRTQPLSVSARMAAGQKPWEEEEEEG